MATPSRPTLFDFHGVSMTNYFTDNWKEIQSIQARPDDIVIATYPKAGTTWVSYILDLLYFGQMDLDHQSTIPLSDKVPFLELTYPTMDSGMFSSLEVKSTNQITSNPNADEVNHVLMKNNSDERCGPCPCVILLLMAHFGEQPEGLILEADALATAADVERTLLLPDSPRLIVLGTDLINKLQTSPRLIKTHLPVQFVPKSFWEQNCRMIYVARNAKDNMVSYFHFDRMNFAQPEPGDWNNFLQRFYQGKMVFGSWYDHVSGWWKKRKTHPKLHYMFYEDLTEDTGREIDKLCSFLGLSPSAEERNRVINGVKFDNMKKNEMTNYSTDPAMDFKISPFMRKGKVGDWKNHFTVAQDEEFDEHYQEKMKDPSLQFRTEI